MSKKRSNTQNLRINKPGLFTPTVVRGIRQGPSNGAVSFARTTNDFASSSINNTGSFKYSVDGTGLRSTQQLNIDWSNFENHTFFNSAQVKTNVAFEKIFNEFPFDGTKKEFELFFSRLTGYEKWIYDNFPKNTGYLFLRNDAYVTVKDVAGSAYPTLSTNRTGDSKLNPGDKSMTIETWLYVPTGSVSSSVILDKVAWPELPTNRQGFYLASSGSTTSTGSVSLYMFSGSIYDQVNIEFEKGKWNHLAWVWDRNQSVQKISSYLNQNFFSSSSQPIEFDTINSGSINLLIGSGSAVSGIFTPETTFSGGLDELRIWHTVRTNEERNLHKEKAVFANNDLKLYFKFNEPSGSNSAVVLDHSGNSLHGRLDDMSVMNEVRDDDPPLLGDSPMSFEKVADSPILFPNQEELAEFREEMLISASLYDNDNPNIITRLVPIHYFIEGQSEDGLDTETGQIVNALQGGNDPRSAKLGATQTLLLMLYTWAKFFDEMKLYTQAFSSLNAVDYDSTDTVPDQFLQFYAKNEGIELPPLFEGSSIEQYIESENIQSDISTNDLSLLAIRNQIWRRVLINLQDVIRSKGTIHSVKSFIRSVGVEPDNNFRIREYGGPSKLSLDFARDNRNEISTMINFISGGLIQSPFLSASKVEPGFPEPSGTDNDSLLTSGSWTFEGTYKIPLENYVYTSQSLVRFLSTGSSSPNNALLANLVTVRGGYTTLFVRQNRLSSQPALEIPITGADLFDGNQWYVSFGRERNDQIGSDISSSYFLRLAKQGYGDILETYTTKSFYNDYDGPITSSSEESLFQNYNSLYNISGSYINIGNVSGGLNNFSTRFLNSSDNLNETSKNTNFAGRTAQIRFWSKALNENEWKEHVRNYRSVGVQDPKTNFNFTTTPTGSWERLRLDVSTDQPVTNSNGAGNITLTDFTQNGFDMTGSGFLATSSVVMPERFYFSYLSPKFDQAATTEKVRVRSYQNFDLVQSTPWAQVAPVYETEPSEKPSDNNRFTIDFSVVDALDQDIVTIFSSLDEFNNALGSPELLFSPDYPDLESLREIYFNKLTDKMNLKLFFEFYKWFDTNIGTFIEQLLPRKTKFLGANFVVENHMLERGKVEYLFSDIYLGENNRHSLKDTILLRLITGQIGRY